MITFTEQGHKIPETFDEAIDKTGEVVFREIDWATDDVEDIDVAWIILMDFINKARTI